MNSTVVRLTALLLVVSLIGCTTMGHVPVQEMLDKPNSRLSRGKDVKISGYVTSNGEYHDFRGYVRLIDGDRIAFHDSVSLSYSNTRPAEMPSLVLSKDDVTTLYVSKPSVAGNMVLGTFAVCVFAVGVAIATKESCPFIYSFDGEHYVFDGEPYGGSTMKALERADVSELEHLVETDGEYRLLLTNEVDETQHTNSIRLLVVDHEPGWTPVADRRGDIRLFRDMEPLLSAREEDGGDLMNWLRKDDRVSWYPSPSILAGRVAADDVRSHITLEFERPEGADEAFLISRAATGQWGSHMIRSMLGLRGEGVTAFYDAVNSSPVHQAALAAWNDREELFHLFPEVEIDGRWVRQSEPIPGGGPFMAERRAIRLDLTGHHGDRVRIRLHPPIGFWDLNSFHLAWGGEPAEPTPLAPAAAVDETGADALATILADDDRYLDFPSPRERAEIRFAAPPRVPGLERTVFAITRGWYEIHLHELGTADEDALRRLAEEPGFAVRLARDEFREYERTGVLRGVRPIESAE